MELSEATTELLAVTATSPMLMANAAGAVATQQALAGWQEDCAPEEMIPECPYDPETHLMQAYAWNSGALYACAAELEKRIVGVAGNERRH